MDKLLKIILFVAGIAVVCAAVSWTMFYFAIDSDKHRESGHEWLHDELGLTAEERGMIEKVEERYAERRHALESEFAEKQNALASLLLEQDEYSSVVKDSVRELQVLNGDFQAMIIEHYYDMLKALPEHKRARLKELAAQALSEPE